MKKYFLIPLAALALAACSNDEDAQSFAPTSDIVQIQPSIGAQIATRTLPAATDSATSTKFTAGDQIMVSKDGTDFYAYTFNGSEWTPVRSNHSSAYLKWGSPTDTEIDLQAYYPASASMTEFALPEFQNSRDLADSDNIKNADFMTFKAKATRGAGNTVSLAMQRRTARVRVTIDKFGNEFDHGAQCYLYIYSPYDKVKVAYNESGADVSGEGQSKMLFPINYQLIEKGGVATALVVPSAEQPNQRFISAFVLDASGTKYSKDTLHVNGIPEHAPGYSYDYHLTIGKNTIAISSVTVTPWTEGTGVTSDGDEAEESDFVINNGVYHVYTPYGLNVWSKAVKADPSLSLTLEDDIDLKGADWTPISTFSGTIDGQGHTIKELTIDNSANADNSAFINTIESNGVVKNLNFADASISGAGAHTAIVACENYGLIENCSVSGSVTGTGRYVGGIVAMSYGNIFGCINNAGITASNFHFVGGIAAITNTTQNFSYVVACANKGNIDVGTGTSLYYVGGLIGLCNGLAYGSWTVPNPEYDEDGKTPQETHHDEDGMGNQNACGEGFMVCYISDDRTTDMNSAIDNYNAQTNVTKCNYKWVMSSGCLTLQKTN